MPALKSDITVAVKVGSKTFSLNCVKLPDRSFLVKHTAMQQREFDVACRKYARMRLPEHLRLEIYGCN